ncbi:sperm flagellar protein 1-like [Aricia agestis]|uniref:sperm flagellar protein 1-like n=1 Tax=Aricia agestis TaxID=91739 RepID=UPI001C209F62|nr:sperm flagellar protein 1-like [Aricia agestis]
MANLESPIPLSDIESVLAWVDTYKLSRPSKKINRDFSDAVLLAEILNAHYPKLVDMHNYPPRNSQALKLNNWLTLNRKVLRKLKLNLCSSTMEQLSNSCSGVIERVLLMVRDKIHRDEEMNRSNREMEQNVSSGGSYYEACGDDENVLIVPLKTRVNGVLEVIQKKVVSHESYLAMKEELKDIKETAETLKQKVEHLDNLLKLKEERIEELQQQLERKQAKRKEIEALQNSLGVPYEEPPSPQIERKKEESKIPVPIDSRFRHVEKEVDKVEKVKFDPPKTDTVDTPEYSEVYNMNIEDAINKEANEIYTTNFVLDLHNNVRN